MGVILLISTTFIEWNKSTNKKQWKEYDMRDTTKKIKMTTAMQQQTWIKSVTKFKNINILLIRNPKS